MDVTLLEAKDLLNDNKVVAVPTETVYGLAASLNSLSAIDQIFTLKGRPSNNPLIIHVASYEDVLPFTKDVDESFFKLANAFWPGPMTLVLPIIEEKVPSRVRAGLKTAAFRVPNHPLTKELLKLTGPLVMPSANLSGKPSSTKKSHIETDFGTDFPVIDGGKCLKGLESTILYKNETYWQIIRQGALAKEDFAAILGYIPEIIGLKKGVEPICPGQLYRHYAPRAKLVLTKEIPENFKGVIVGFEERIYPKEATIYFLGNLNDPISISKNLYHTLRQLDEDQIKETLIDINFEETGILRTVLERLQKASI